MWQHYNLIKWLFSGYCQYFTADFIEIPAFREDMGLTHYKNQDMLIWCKMKMSIGEWTPAFSGEDFLGGFWEVMWGRKLYLWGLWGQNWVVWPSALMVIGDVHNYPAMHCFGIPRHTQSMITFIRFLLSQSENSGSKLHCRKVFIRSMQQ